MHFPVKFLMEENEIEDMSLTIKVKLTGIVLQPDFSLNVEEFKFQHIVISG